MTDNHELLARTTTVATDYLDSLQSRPVGRPAMPTARSATPELGQ